LFRKNLTWIQTPPCHSFQSQICFVLPSIVWVAVCHIYQARAQLNAKKILAASSSFHAILRNNRINDACYRTADTRKPRDNAIVRRLASSFAWKLSFLVFPRVALPYPQFLLRHSVTCVQIRLIAILGNCGCVAVASFLGVPPPLDSRPADKVFWTEW
jgi:hypothetical protein